MGRSSVGLLHRLTALILETDLITRYYCNETLTQCCFNVRSATLANIKPTFDECTIFAGKALTVNMQLFLNSHGNTTLCVSTQSPHERTGELFTHRCRTSI